MDPTPAATGMEAVVTALTTGLTPAVFFDTVAKVIPFVVILVPVCRGLYFLRKLIKGSGKGKVRF